MALLFQDDFSGTASLLAGRTVSGHTYVARAVSGSESDGGLRIDGAGRLGVKTSRSELYNWCRLPLPDLLGESYCSVECDIEVLDIGGSYQQILLAPFSGATYPTAPALTIVLNSGAITITADGVGADYSVPSGMTSFSARSEVVGTAARLFINGTKVLDNTIAVFGETFDADSQTEIRYGVNAASSPGMVLSRLRIDTDGDPPATDPAAFWTGFVGTYEAV